MPARVRRMEFEDIEGFSGVSMVNEAREDFYREIAMTTVKPVLERIKHVYIKYGRRYPWNALVAVGLRIYSLARKGYDMDYYAFARALARSWGLPDAVVRDLVNEILAEVTAAAPRR